MTSSSGRRNAVNAARQSRRFKEALDRLSAERDITEASRSPVTTPTLRMQQSPGDMDPMSLVFLPPGEPGRLDERRVYVRFPDGCTTGFAQDRAVSVADAVRSHEELHRDPGEWRP